METLNYPTTFGVSTFRQRHDDYNPRCRTCRSLRGLDHRFDPSYHAGIQTLFVTLHLMYNLLWQENPTMAHWQNTSSSIYILENRLPCLYSPWALRLAGDDALCAIQPVSRRSCRLLKAVLQLGVHLFDQMMKGNQYRSTFRITNIWSVFTTISLYSPWEIKKTIMDGRDGQQVPCESIPRR